MSNKHMQKHRKPRAGSGYPLHIARQELPLPGGGMAISARIDFSDAPVPERKYAADVAAVFVKHGSLHLAFGQEKISGDDLRSLIVVVMSANGVRWFLDTCEQFEPKLSEYTQREKVAEVPLREIRDEPAQTVQMVANILAASFSDREACLDFYHVSPAVVRELNDGVSDQIPIEPVVRVDLSTALLRSLVGAILEMKAAFTAGVS